jgi:CBS domain-containing protein
MLVSPYVRDVMTAEVLTVSPDTPVVEVAERLANATAGSLVVCNEGDSVGIVTRTDLFGILAGREDPGRTLVVDVMSVDLVTVGPDDSVERAAELVAEHDIAHLPAVAPGPDGRGTRWPDWGAPPAAPTPPTATRSGRSNRRVSRTTT